MTLTLNDSVHTYFIDNKLFAIFLHQFTRKFLQFNSGRRNCRCSCVVYTFQNVPFLSPLTIKRLGFSYCQRTHTLTCIWRAKRIVRTHTAYVLCVCMRVCVRVSPCMSMLLVCTHAVVVQFANQQKHMHNQQSFICCNVRRID